MRGWRSSVGRASGLVALGKKPRVVAGSSPAVGLSSVVHVQIAEQKEKGGPNESVPPFRLGQDPRQHADPEEDGCDVDLDVHLNRQIGPHWPGSIESQAPSTRMGKRIGHLSERYNRRS